METAISIPADLYQQAEMLAQQFGLSHTQLVTQALEQWVKTQQAADIGRRWEEFYTREEASPDPLDDSEITRKLNEIYAQEDSSPDPVLSQLQFEVWEREDR